MLLQMPVAVCTPANLRAVRAHQVRYCGDELFHSVGLLNKAEGFYKQGFHPVSNALPGRIKDGQIRSARLCVLRELKTRLKVGV